MDAEVVDKIAALTMKGLETKDIDGLPYMPIQPHLVKPPEVDAIKMMSLSSLVLFVDKANIKPDGFMYHIAGPTRVRLVSIGYNKFMQRQTLGVADVTDQVENHFDYGHKYNLENFIIALKAGFQETDNLKRIIELCSKIRISDDDELEDDGITQTVSVKAGVTLKGKETVPNPVELVPFKTFPEITVPPEKFVFRVQKGGYDKATFALYKSKSMAWEMYCVEQIKKFLVDASSLPVI